MADAGTVHRCCVRAALSRWREAPLAQDWPTRPITLVVPYAAGGSVDGNGRTMAQRMGEILGQQVVVENVGGAGGMTGSLRVARAAPDGYHIRDRQSRQPRRQPDALQAAALQFDDGLHAGRPRQSGPVRAAGAQGFSGEHAAGVHRLRQGERGQAAVRLRRRRLDHAHGLRTAQHGARASTPRTFPIAAPGPRCRTWSEAGSTTSASRCRPRCR